MKLKKLSLSHAIRAGLWSAAFFAASQAHALDVDVQLVDYDLDHNGTVVVEEANKARHIHFAAADLDQDGALSMKEFFALSEAQRLRRIEASFVAVDTDVDGSITVSELQAFLPGADVETMLLNAAGDDKVLSKDEFAAMRLMESGVNADAMWDFSLLDSNHDQKLTVAEFSSSLWKGVEPKPAIQPPVIPVPEKPEGGVTATDDSESETQSPLIKMPEPAIQPPVIPLPEKPQDEQPPVIPVPEKPEPAIQPPVIPLPEKPELQPAVVNQTAKDPAKTGLDTRISKLKEQISKVEANIASTKAKLETATGKKAEKLAATLKSLEKDLAYLQARLAKLTAV